MKNSDVLELACNLAHNRTLYESGDICCNEDEMYKDYNSDLLEYLEEIQERFNYWYDYYYTEITKIVEDEI